MTTAVQERPDQATDIVARAKAVAQLADAESAAGDRQGYVSPSVTQAMRDQKLYWALVPESLGGLETDISSTVRIIEEVSRADGSTGWSLMATSVATMGAAAYGTDALAEAMFGGGKPSVVAGQLGIGRGSIKPADGGYIFGGNFAFASGSTDADWIGAGVRPVVDGVPASHPGGVPMVTLAFFPKSKVEMQGNWDVFGLRGTGSVDYTVPEQFVPEEFTLEWTCNEPKRGTTGILHAGMRPVAQAAHTGVIIGMTARALSEIAGMAQVKTRNGIVGLTADSPLFQSEFMLHEAAFKAARAYLYEVTAMADARLKSGDKLTDTDIARVLQASIWAHKVGGEVTKFCFTWGASEALRLPNTLERCLRNVFTGLLHVIIDPVLLPTAAKPVMKEWAAWRPGE